MADAEKMTKDDPQDEAWNADRVGNDATMKEHSHKEYEARDTKRPPSDPGQGGGSPPPQGTGESTTRGGEDVSSQEGREFEHKGTSGADRPVGTHDPEDIGVANKPNIDGDMPNVQHP